MSVSLWEIKTIKKKHNNNNNNKPPNRQTKPQKNPAKEKKSRTPPINNPYEILKPYNAGKLHNSAALIYFQTWFGLGGNAFAF